MCKRPKRKERRNKAHRRPNRSVFFLKMNMLPNYAIAFCAAHYVQTIIISKSDRSNDRWMEMDWMTAKLLRLQRWILQFLQRSICTRSSTILKFFAIFGVLAKLKTYLRKNGFERFSVQWNIFACGCTTDNVNVLQNTVYSSPFQYGHFKLTL